MRNKPVPGQCANGRRLWLLGMALAVAPTAFSQASQDVAAQTWAEQLKAQTWATQNVGRIQHRQEWATISRGDRTLKAWIDYPKADGKAPVVLVLHETFGLTDSTRYLADEIEAMGYIAIVPDMLSGRGPDGGDTSSFSTPQAAAQALIALPDRAVNTDLNTWADYGNKLPGSTGQLAIVGLSWGGGAAFRYAAATQRKDLKAIFVFYGVGPLAISQGPAADMGSGAFSLASINVPVYGFYGSKDSRVLSSLKPTRAAMAAAHKVYEPMVYEDADDAYMRLAENPANGNLANIVAATASLMRLDKLLNDVLR